MLQDEVIKNLFLNEFKSRLDEMPQEWNPHLKLEYSKMCIRTIAEQLQSDRKKREKAEEELVNEELDLTMKALGNVMTPARDIPELISHVKNLRIQKEIMIEEKGKRLASKLGTKWYNEAGCVNPDHLCLRG